MSKVEQTFDEIMIQVRQTMDDLNRAHGDELARRERFFQDQIETLTRDRDHWKIIADRARRGAA